MGMNFNVAAIKGKWKGRGWGLGYICKVKILFGRG